MAKMGNRRFKTSRVKVFTTMRDGVMIRVTREKIKGQKLRDMRETVETFIPAPTRRNIPGVWVGEWK